MNIRYRSWHGIIAIMVVMAALAALVVGAPTLGTANTDKGDEFYSGKTPKYVFMFIGDGMSYSQVSSAEMFLGQQPDPANGVYPKPKQLNFTQFPTHGALMTQDSTSFLPDSASTATSLASGRKTLSGVINMDETKTKEYNPITEALKAKGYKIGIVTSVPITHATPAAFYAKVPSRNNAYDIGKQLAASGFDYFGGGSFDQPTGPNKDQKHILEIVQEAGYKIADTNEEVNALNNASGKVVAINPVLDGTAMNYEIDREEGELSLSDFVKKGIEVLDNPKGFFMMVESGKIDWANHANDAAASIHDTIAFADAIQEALEFYKKYPNDTLIVVTADHETGGMSIGWSNTGYSTYFNKIKPVSMSYVEFDKVLNEYKKTVTRDTAKLEDLMDEIQSGFGITSLSEYEKSLLNKALDWSMVSKEDRKKLYTEQEKILYGDYEPFTVKLSHIVNSRAGLSYTTYSHTGVPVPVYAIGLGEDMFDGFYDNTSIYYKLAAITKIKH
ncbi:MAG: alkaline phosphatase [Bacillota bacterium]